MVVLLAIGSLAACTSPKSQSAAIAVESELKLTPGTFPGLRGTALGDPVDFENDIYNTKCYPLMDAKGGPPLLWVSRAHVAGGRVFIQPCEVETPVEMPPASRKRGHISEWLFEATLVDASTPPRIGLHQLALQNWGWFATASFCGNHVAYWSQAPGGEMTAHVANLFDLAIVGMASFGVVPITASDMGMGVSEAAWTSDCSVATFTRVPGETRAIRIPKKP